MNENQQDSPIPAPEQPEPVENFGGPGLPPANAVCGFCIFLAVYKVKGGPGAIGQEQDRSECRRFPPAMVPVLALPVDALMEGMAIMQQQSQRPGIIGVAAAPRQRPMVILQPSGGAPAYPPTPPHFPACGEFTPRDELLGGGAGFVHPEAQGGHENQA